MRRTRSHRVGGNDEAVENFLVAGLVESDRQFIATDRHRPAAEVKGVTYTALEVSRRADGQWLAQCVVDV